jgi:hypothetical protein
MKMDKKKDILVVNGHEYKVKTPIIAKYSRVFKRLQTRMVSDRKHHNDMLKNVHKVVGKYGNIYYTADENKK